jgi:hypothetical protein
MALTAATVASDPASAAHTNTALATTVAHATTATTRYAAVFAVWRELIRLSGASVQLLEDFDVAVRTFSAATPSAATVTTDPATEAETETAFGVVATAQTNLNTNAKAVTDLFREFLRLRYGYVPALVKYDAAQVNLAAGATITGELVTTDPVTQAEMNTALANATAVVDTIYAEVLAVMTDLPEIIKRVNGNKGLIAQAEDALAALVV